MKTVKQNYNSYENKTILLVEDVAINAILFDEYLFKSKVRIIHAKNGTIALEKLQLHPEIDLVLMDIRLPDIDGIELTKQMKLKRDDLKIVAQTAHSEDYRQECIDAGCNDFMSKPIRQEKLYGILNNYLV